MSYVESDLPDPDHVRTFSQDPAPSLFEAFIAFLGRLYEVFMLVSDFFFTS